MLQGPRESQVDSEATKKACCSEQMSKTEAKKRESEEDATQTVEINQVTSKPARLREKIKEVESATRAEEQVEMNEIRQEMHSDCKTARADPEWDLNGVPKALDVLRDQRGAGAAAMLQDDIKFVAVMQQSAMPEHHSRAQGAKGACVAGQVRGEEGSGLLEHGCR